MMDGFKDDREKPPVSRNDREWWFDRWAELVLDESPKLEISCMLWVWGGSKLEDLNLLKVQADELCKAHGVSPTEAALAMAEVLAHGARKYEWDSWRRVSNGATRYTDALLRHLMEISEGERYDSESGFTHIAHSLCNIYFIEELLREEARRDPTCPDVPLRSGPPPIPDEAKYARELAALERSLDIQDLVQCGQSADDV